MQIDETAVEPDGGLMPLLAAAEMQDHLMTVNNDLERLQRLLDDACEALSTHFFGASSLVDQLKARAASEQDTDALQQLMLHLAGAITALQFQDMSTQLIAHTSQRLRNCSDQLARDTFGEDEDGLTVVETAPLRPNPVTQDEMDAGSVELF
ncbi:hypothetical protein [Roseateles amylovorans]|uniref:Chemotaxis protein CheZ n=1 Tax=Roseateles amylovorans TaxID=2978473 RepID=A0ABY6B302_9BURK|nr:hypothetical protein [Roseateles amylovorans]UXH79771.1 hypothetical protein N4261_07735 [Roseateles amylovorans]